MNTTNIINRLRTAFMLVVIGGILGLLGSAVINVAMGRPPLEWLAGNQEPNFYFDDAGFNNAQICWSYCHMRDGSNFTEEQIRQDCKSNQNPRAICENGRCHCTG